jgi:hypothetical protein
MNSLPRQTETSPEAFDLIHSYTRAQAIADGVIVDVTATAREAGILWPVALTAAVHAEYVAVPSGVECQDEAGRLWDILWMLACALRRRPSGSRFPFRLYVRNTNRAPRLFELHAVVAGGDHGEPTLTVMLPHED